MATFNSFEDIEAWKISRELANKIFKIFIEPNLSNDFALKNQINRSSGSIMDNIAEGFERSGSMEFIQFLSYSKGSAGEVKSQLYRALDRKYITQEEFQELYDMANNIGKMLRSLIEYLNKTPIKGEKFKFRDQQKTKN